MGTRLDSLAAEWKHLGRREGFGFVAADGEPQAAAAGLASRTAAIHPTGVKIAR